MSTLDVLSGRLGLGTEVGGGGAGLGEEAAKEWLDEGVEDDLGATSLGKSHPEDEDELEGVVEWEPVDGVDRALEDGEECKADPVSQPLSIIRRGRAEQSFNRVVPRDDESRSVDEELSSDIEEDEEKVQGRETKDDVDLGDRRLLLKVVESWVLGQLFVQLADLVVCALLERHACGGYGAL